MVADGCHWPDPSRSSHSSIYTPHRIATSNHVPFAFPNKTKHLLLQGCSCLGPVASSMATLVPSPCFQFLVSTCIPPELVLKTIQHLPFEDGPRIASLRQSPRLRSLMKTYEHSITSCFMKKELRHARDDFPDNGEFDLSLEWLSYCVSRYNVIDAIMDELTWRENCVAVEPHNVSCVNAGLLLLYRLASIRKYSLNNFTTLQRNPSPHH
jgi:hypothetical protein